MKEKLGGDAFDPDVTFFIDECFYVIGPDPLPDDTEAAARSLLRVAYAKAGAPGRYVVAFTDTKLAEDFLGRMGDAGAALVPHEVARGSRGWELVVFLKACDDRFIGFDPEPHRVRIFHIAEVVRYLTDTAGEDE